ncbi:MAG: hypothetical protein HN906_08485 [Acidiferrobacteraceae bacterium]|nr:hypothetical protein [Acidiferrobacteraceae bacterium]
MIANCLQWTVSRVSTGAHTVAAFFLAGVLTSISWAQPLEAGVYDLTRQGWQITATTERKERRPGIAPYIQLPRIISVTDYRLEKSGQVIICEMRYDSQRDRQDETCMLKTP